MKNSTTGCTIETLPDGTEECIHLKDEPISLTFKRFKSSLCMLEKNSDELTNLKDDNLTFYNANNLEIGFILVAPKKQICASSDYFQV